MLNPYVTQPQGLLTTRELAGKLGVSKGRVFQLMRSRGIKATYEDARGFYFAPELLTALSPGPPGCPRGTKRQPGLKRRRARQAEIDANAQLLASIPFTPNGISRTPAGMETPPPAAPESMIFDDATLVERLISNEGMSRRAAQQLVDKWKDATPDYRELAHGMKRLVKRIGR